MRETENVATFEKTPNSGAGCISADDKRNIWDPLSLHNSHFTPYLFVVLQQVPKTNNHYVLPCLLRRSMSYSFIYSVEKEHAVAHLVEALRYKSEGRGFDSRWCNWNFSINIILPGRTDRLCGLVVRVSGYRYRGPGFDSRRYQIF